MKILTRLIFEAKAKIEKRLAEIEELDKATPLQDIIKLREEARPLMLEMQKTKRPTDAQMKELSRFAKEEKRLNALAKRQNEGWAERTTEKVELQSELADIASYIFYKKLKES